MRRHVIYTLTDDDDLALQARHIDELRAIFREHLGPEEAEDAVRRGPRGPNHRGYKALSRIGTGFMAEDVAALRDYAGVLLDRRGVLIAQVRAERERRTLDDLWQRNYDGLVATLEAGQARAEAILARFVEAFHAAVPAAEPSPSHP